MALIKKRKRNYLVAGHLERLTDMSPESMYWLGYMLADGSISRRGEFSIASSGNDLGHLQRFATLVSS